MGYAARFLTPSRERITAFLYRPLGEKAPPERDCIAPPSRRLCVQLHIVTLDASIAIILMYIKSEVADLILFKKREGFILLPFVLVLEVSSTYPN